MDDSDILKFTWKMSDNNLHNDVQAGPSVPNLGPLPSSSQMVFQRGVSVINGAHLQQQIPQNPFGNAVQMSTVRFGHQNPELLPPNVTICEMAFKSKEELNMWYDELYETMGQEAANKFAAKVRQLWELFPRQQNQYTMNSNPGQQQPLDPLPPLETYQQFVMGIARPGNYPAPPPRRYFNGSGLYHEMVQHQQTGQPLRRHSESNAGISLHHNRPCNNINIHNNRVLSNGNTSQSMYRVQSLEGNGIPSGNSGYNHTHLLNEGTNLIETQFQSNNLVDPSLTDSGHPPSLLYYSHVHLSQAIPPIDPQSDFFNERARVATVMSLKPEIQSGVKTEVLNESINTPMMESRSLLRTPVTSVTVPQFAMVPQGQQCLETQFNTTAMVQPLKQGVQAGVGRSLLKESIRTPMTKSHSVSQTPARSVTVPQYPTVAYDQQCQKTNFNPSMPSPTAMVLSLKREVQSGVITTAQKESTNTLMMKSHCVSRTPARSVTVPQLSMVPNAHQFLEVNYPFYVNENACTPSPTAENLVKQPTLLMVGLMKHQQSAVKWMQFRERQNICGGIVADDMGLGKTLSMIALVVADKQMQIDKEDENEPQLKRVCHASLTGDCSSKEFHKYFTTNDYPPAGTLVVCPKSVMSQWAQEVTSKVAPNAIKTLIFHDTNRLAVKLEELRSCDLVITSYNLLWNEYKRFGNNSPLFAAHWNRVILDEAHIIRNDKCCGGISVCQLRSRCRWALSGTLVQNLVKDMLTLLRFLKVPQFHDLQVWKKYLNEGLHAQRGLHFLIQPLMMRRTKQELEESGDLPALPNLNVELICVQFSEAEKAVYEILFAICQKIFTKYLVQIENYAVESTPQFINEIFDAKYSGIYHGFLKLFNYDPKVRFNGLVISNLLLRLRQFCCHPALLLGMLSGSKTDEDLPNTSLASDVEGQFKMDVLEEFPKSEGTTEETDPFIDVDSAEVNENVQLKKEPLMAIKENIMPWSMGDEQPLEAARALKQLSPQNPIFQLKHSSAKLELVIDKVQEILTFTNDKVIIISQWVSYLDIIRTNLENHSCQTLYYTGQLSTKNRQLVLDDFNASNGKRVLLLSLTAGGVGLNLHVANHLLIVDPHWNPQLERQAQDRIHRFGQKKPTFIYRYMCENTIEQRILALQEYKFAKMMLPEIDGEVYARDYRCLNIDDFKKLFLMDNETLM
ncbi:transcription termination factor 2-like isoform X1 [Drosophila takahashii]|uniref:transcription termination factor 2-like isoform X1 n=1 Tax=Drosophila takahashii TaxID=29030 RepID=UPI0038990A2A